jgi:hypothetical protein
MPWRDHTLPDERLPVPHSRARFVLIQHIVTNPPAPPVRRVSVNDDDSRFSNCELRSYVMTDGVEAGHLVLERIDTREGIGL